LMYSNSHLHFVCFSTAFINNSWSMLSKSPLMSNSNTQSFSQHLFRVTASASCADFPGRYPYESGRKYLSTFSSKRIFTTICAILSATVGMPSILTPPFPLGISTAFTAGGKQVPDDILFHILYRFFFKSLSNCARDT